VIEAKLDKAVVRLRPCWCSVARSRIGDVFVCGAASGKVRAMIDDHGRR
jgi:translation initiation factor IF-2